MVEEEEELLNAIGKVTCGRKMTDLKRKEEALGVTVGRRAGSDRDQYPAWQRENVRYEGGRDATPINHRREEEE